jgi:hypothetical protein
MTLKVSTQAIADIEAQHGPDYTILNKDGNAYIDQGQMLNPAGVRYATLYRNVGAANSAMYTGGTIHLTPLYVPAGLIIPSISYATGAGTSAATNQWFGICDSTATLRAVTTDDLTTNWAAQTVKTLNINQVAGLSQSYYKVPGAVGTIQQIFLALAIAGASPTMPCVAVANTLAAMTPKVGNTTMTTATVPQATDGSVTYTFVAANQNIPYAYV